MSPIEQRGHDLLRFVPVGMVVLDRSSNIILANEAAVSLLGLPQLSECALLNFRDWVQAVPDNGSSFPLAEILDARGPLRFPLLVRGQKRSEVTVQATAWTVRTSGNLEICVCLEESGGAPFLDGSQNTHSDWALRSEQLLSRGVISQAVDSIFVIDREGAILSANPEAERVFGWSEEELVGRNLHSTLHHHYPSGENYPISNCPINKVHVSGEPIRGVELVFFRKEGAPLDVSCSNVPLTVGSERIGAALIIRDISQRKAMEKALVESEERLRVAIASANMGTWDYNPVTKTGRWDAQCKRSFGLSPARLVNYGDFVRSVHPDDRKKVAESVRRALDPAGDGRFAAEFRTVGPSDHVLRYTDARGQAFFGTVADKQRAIRFIGTVADVTARKKSEEALRRANEDLRQFAYAAAHDLQEPLRNVVNLLGLYKRTNPAEENSGDELIDESIEDARRMHRMVRDLLSFTKVSEGDVVPQGSTEPAEVLREVMEGLTVQIEEAGANIAFGHLPAVNIQPTHLRQLWQNLISNALKYRRTGAKPTIKISATRIGREWVFAVADNGIGFDPMYAQRIFGVFKRLHGRNDYPGSGIGLAICSRIISLYGGRIWAEGRPGAGATFFFTVPVTEAHQ